MKFDKLIILFAIALLGAGCMGEAPSEQASPQAESPTTATSEESPTDSVAQAPEASGVFVAAEHPTQGMAKVVTDNGQRYLEFDEAFQTDSGPDLFVLLHREETPQSYAEENFVNLGELQQTTGTQRYAIPADVDPAEFSSVVIWCRQFNVTFGYAPFES